MNTTLFIVCCLLAFYALYLLFRWLFGGSVRDSNDYSYTASTGCNGTFDSGYDYGDCGGGFDGGCD